MKGLHKETRVQYDSGFEKKFLDQCWLQGIKVVRCPDKVPYLDTDGKWRTFEPDFLLPEFEYVVEIKGAWAFKTNHGYVKEKFFAATKFFKGRFTMVTEKELKSDFVARLHKELAGGD